MVLFTVLLNMGIMKEYKDIYFNFLNEELINKIIKDSNLEIIDILITNDVIKNRDNERWLNVMLKRK